MGDLVAEAMEAGAIGVSTALIYPPAVYAPTDEIAGLAAVAGRYGGRYYTHMRNEGDRLVEAIDEALEIGRRGKTPVHIFHLKAAGRQNWGKMQLAIASIKAARAAGEQVTADIYPYINNGLGIAAFIHPRHFCRRPASGSFAELDDPALRAEIRNEMETTAGWENWYRHVGRDWNKVIIGQTADRRYAPLAGQSVAEMAKAKNEDPWDTFFNLVRAGAFALPESMSEENKLLALPRRIHLVLHRCRPRRRLANRLAPAGLRFFPAAALQIRSRAGRHVAGAGRRSGQRRRGQRRDGLRPRADRRRTRRRRHRVRLRTNRRQSDVRQAQRARRSA